MSALVRLWGKTNEREKGYDAALWRYHPAIFHMIDVGYVAESWLRHCPSIAHRFCRLAPGIEAERVSRIIVAITALHDLGKVHRSFQSKSEAGWRQGYGSDGRVRESDAGIGFDHGKATARIMRELARRELPSWSKWLPIIDAAAAHHGRIFDADDLTDNNSRIYKPMTSWERESAVDAVMIVSDLFGLRDELPPPPSDNGFLMMLAGFCSVSDWLGSDSSVFDFRSDVALDGGIGLSQYLDELRSSSKAPDLLRSAGIIGSFTDQPPTFESLFDYLRPPSRLRPAQAASLAIPFGENPGPEMVIVEAPMGAGKTELALLLAARSIHAGTADGVYFALPTQASSNAIFDRIDTFARSIAPPGGEISVALAHGGRRYNARYRTLLERSRLLQRALVVSREHGSRDDEENAAPSEVIAPQWLQSSKRSLLSAVGVGTIDQAMLGAISVRHSFVRLYALAGKTVVFDEIHAYDDYMNVVILRLLGWLRALGTKVVLLSATLPRGLRTRFVEAYGSTLAAEVDAEAVDEPYPQMIHVREGIARKYVPDESSTDAEKHVRLSLHRCEEDARTEHGADLVTTLAATGGCIGWIRNTVREAQDAWREVKRIVETGHDHHARPTVVLLHARFTRFDRNRIEEDLIEVLGRNGGDRRPERMIVIATQVIEQSVDLDFDALVSDLAPVDLLLQRAGRLWRHTRPLDERRGHVEPVLHVLLPSESEVTAMRFGASAYIYDEETLARTSRLLDGEPVWELPNACRRLVAELYDRDGTYWIAERLSVDIERLAGARERRARVQQTMEGTARAILVTKPGGTTLQTRHTYSDDDRGDSIALTTRYGGASGTVVLVRAGVGGVALVGSENLELATLPDGSRYDEILDLEEAVVLSSVSFPWYGALVQPPIPALSALIRWWGERHPYDHKVFLLLDEDGSFAVGDLAGRYSLDPHGRSIEGLVIARRRETTSLLLVEYETL